MNEILNYDDYEELDDSQFSQMVNSSLDRVDSVCTLVSNVSCSLADTTKAITNVRLEIAKLDAQLDTFIVETQSRIEKFKVAAPILEKQLEKASERIDRITDTILSQSSNSLSGESLEKQRMLIDLLGQTNDTFNNLLVKLITI